MASQALYLKWRPRQFEDVVGQEHVTRTLRNAMRGGRIAHAYLFTGPRGTGKTTMARLLAKAVNCVDEDVANRPCNRCRICQSINEGRLLDLIEMDAASHTGVDNVREAIRDKVGFRPSEARYKVYVIDEVHMLSTSAFNALLKTLEEPPEHVIFVLATTEPHRLLPTIVSRCQRFDFRRIPISALMARLRQIADAEGIQITDSALRFVARTSTGSARDAISLLDQLTSFGDDEITVERLRSVLGYSDSEIVHRLVAHLCAHEIGPGLTVIQQAVGQGVEMRQFAQQVVDTMRSVLLMRVGGELSADALLLDVDERTQERLHELAELFSVHDLLRAIKLFNQAQLDLRGSDQSQLALELAFVEAALPEAQPAAAPPAAAHDTTPRPVSAPSVSAPSVSAPSVSAPSVSAPQTTEQKPAVEEAAPAASLAPQQPVQKSRRGASPPPAAPPRAEDRVSAPEAETLQESKSELAPDVLAPDYLGRMQSEISSALRAEGPLGKNADGLFRSVFVIGDVRVLNSNEILLGLPPNVLSRVTGDITQTVEKVIGSVLGKSCSVRFVEKGSVSAPSAGAHSRSKVEQDTEVQPASQVAASVRNAEERETYEEGVAAETRDAYQEAVSDPVVQDLVSRGGQVTGVQVLSEE